MNLNGPGTSLFQGSDIQFLNIVNHGDEEEEFIEDERRRNIELKNLIDNAFEDVSFDNDEGSNFNTSNNHSLMQQKLSTGIDILQEVGMSQSQIDFINNCTGDNVEDFNTPLRHTRNVKSKVVDFTSDSNPSSEQNRVHQQNGNLHDIVDASGGGDVATSMHYKHCFRTSPLGEEKSQVTNNGENIQLNKQYQEANYNSIEQLQILYDVRVREVHRLTELIDTMKNKHEVEKAEWKKQMALSFAEKERNNLSQTQLQSLLVASKQQIDDLEKEVETLKANMNALEKSKEEITEELEVSKVAINDLQRKVLVYEKGNRDKTETMQYEMNLKAMTEKHNCEMKQLQTQLDVCLKSYEAKDKEIDQLKLKISELNQLNDENLAKKAEIVNRLSKQIEETQEQCEKLMKTNVAEDNIKLQMELKFFREENQCLNAKLENLEKELVKRENELKQYESLYTLSVFDSSQLDDSSKDKEGDYSDLNSKLRAELYRALASQKAKRQEISNLHNMLKGRDDKIQMLIEKERACLADIAKFQEEKRNLLEDIKKQRSAVESKRLENETLQAVLDQNKTEVEDHLANARHKCQKLERENESLKTKVANLEANFESEKLISINKCNDEFMRFHNEGLTRVREECQESQRTEILKKNLEIDNLRREIEEVKNMYVEVHAVKENLLKQIEKEKNTSGRSSVDLDEVKRLQKELDKSRQRILDLDQTLRQQYQQEVEKLNAEIKHLNLEIEKAKKEKEHVNFDKDKIITENELLKTEVEQITLEKNLYFLNCEKLTKEKQQLTEEIEKLKESASNEIDHLRELQDVKNKYDIQIKKLNKEIELMMTNSVATESKYTSPTKISRRSIRNAATQASPTIVETKATSPLFKSAATKEMCTSPICISKKEPFRDISVLTDPEPKQLPKREVIEMMQRLAERHEDEMKALESKYRLELSRIERKVQLEMEKVKEEVRKEMTEYYGEEIERLEEKHRIEMENRVEQEKKEAVVALITEWACEVQSLKHSHAEAKAEVEKMRAKYKTAKSVALHYKTYFKTKSEHMKEEWKKIEDGYEKALKELEKNVHILVDVKEDEVKAKVESITKIYEQKINKMKDKLAKCENRLKSDGSSSKKEMDVRKKTSSRDLNRKEIERLHLTKGYRNALSRRDAEDRLSARDDGSSDTDRGYENVALTKVKDWVKVENGHTSDPDKKVRNGLLGRKEMDKLSLRDDPLSDKDRTSR